LLPVTRTTTTVSIVVMVMGLAAIVMAIIV
jgi:hypothetical protein